jgi:dethiobiotin synthetase
VAAERAGSAITRARLLGLVSDLDHAVVEGAGGLLVELGTDGTTVADIAEDLELPLVVVVRPGLGTLNHTQLTCEAAWARGLRVAGIVVNGYPPDPGVAEQTNLDRLARIAPLLEVIPHFASESELPRVTAPALVG